MPPPYGSVPPHVMRPQPPAKKKSSALMWILVVGTVGLCGAVAATTGYLVWRAKTPEGKRELAAARDRDQAIVDDAVQMLTKVATTLPRHEDGATKCAANMPLLFATKVDSAYLLRLSGGEPAKEEYEALEPWRSFEMNGDLLRAASDMRAGQPIERNLLSKVARASTSLVAPAAETPLKILSVDTWEAPKVEGGEFSAGAMTGQIVLFDAATRKIACHAPIHAESSESVSYGGGVRFRVKGIPTPKVGGSGDLATAVKNDFEKNVDAAIARALQGIGATP